MEERLLSFGYGPRICPGMRYGSLYWLVQLPECKLRLAILLSWKIQFIIYRTVRSIYFLYPCSDCALLPYYFITPHAIVGWPPWRACVQLQTLSTTLRSASTAPLKRSIEPSTLQRRWTNYHYVYQLAISRSLQRNILRLTVSPHSVAISYYHFNDCVETIHTILSLGCYAFTCRRGESRTQYRFCKIVTKCAHQIGCYTSAGNHLKTATRQLYMH